MSTRRAIRQNAPPALAPSRAVLAPELVDPRGPAAWEVRQAAGGLQGGTNLQDRRMHAPGHDSDGAHAVRLHELLHARITPPTLMAQCQADGRSWDASQASEDARLNETAEAHGIRGMLAGCLTDEQAVTMVTATLQAARQLESVGAMPGAGHDPSRMAYHRAACIAVAFWRTGQFQAAYGALQAQAPSDVVQAVSTALRAIRQAYPNPESTIRAARHLDALLQPTPAPGQDSEGENRWEDKQAPPTTEELGDLDAAADATTLLRPRLERAASHRTRAVRRTTDAGRLTRPTETLRPEGGRPFSRKRRSVGAVILLDSSGSMGYSHEDLADIVAACPSALVMIHASQGDQGFAAVVAEGGRCISPDALAEVRGQVGGGNANDAGAVALAARLADRARIKGPRWWVTDEGFGDCHGSIGHNNITEHCRASARWHGFGIVPHESDVFA